MSQPYGQQPEQPGGGQPQSGGFPQAPGYPQTPGQGQPAQGYPQGQGYGSMPSAPQEYSSGPIPRPGTATAAAVLAFVQAGITAIPGVLQLLAVADNANDLDGSTLAQGFAIALAELVGVALLIIGGVQLMGGKSRTMLVIGAGLELVICLYYIIRTAAVDSEGIDAIDTGKGVIIAFAVFFAIMPAIILVMSLGATTTQFLQSRQGR